MVAHTPTWCREQGTQRCAELQVQQSTAIVRSGPVPLRNINERRRVCVFSAHSIYTMKTVRQLCSPRLAEPQAHCCCTAAAQHWIVDVASRLTLFVFPRVRPLRVKTCLLAALAIASLGEAAKLITAHGKCDWNKVMPRRSWALVTCLLVASAIRRCLCDQTLHLHLPLWLSRSLPSLLLVVRRGRTVRRASRATRARARTATRR